MASHGGRREGSDVCANLDAETRLAAAEGVGRPEHFSLGPPSAGYTGVLALYWSVGLCKADSRFR